MIALREFQQHLETNIHAAWAAGHRNVLAVSATGSGKTVLMSKILHDHVGGAIAIAHRRELVGQISIALARNGVRHRIIAPISVQREIASLHLGELNKNYIDPGARIGVAGVDTLINREISDPWFRTVTLWVQDEAHHVLRANKWGKAAEFFPNARGLGVTATPCRADGRGLGRQAEGLFDRMVLAPTMRDLINLGYLTDYRIIAPPSDLDLSSVPIGASGEYVQQKLSAAVHSSHLTGDVVAAYLKYAKGKLGVTFSVDIEAAKEIAIEFRAKGVPAEVITSKTPDGLRLALLRKFKAKEILQLVNVDLFGEGFDLPAIEVVSMARPTASFSLYSQQFGRALRLMLSRNQMIAWESFSPDERRSAIADSSKPHAIIIDHARNYERHGLPDARRYFSLDSRERKGNKKTAEIPIRVCPECTQAYERVHAQCPYCGFRPEPQSRSSPEFVDGDMAELDPDVLRFLRGEIIKADSGFVAIPHGATQAVIGAKQKQQRERQVAQTELRAWIAQWGGYHKAQGQTDSEAQRRFYFEFNVDVANAQLLNASGAMALTEKIKIAIDRLNNSQYA